MPRVAVVQAAPIVFDRDRTLEVVADWTARAADEDVICKGHKVLGSAQRRRRGAILQHGSLLLHQSPHAPEFPGLLDLVAGLTLPEDFPETMARAISESLQWQAALEPLSESERTEIEGLAAGNLAGLRTRSGS